MSEINQSTHYIQADVKSLFTFGEIVGTGEFSSVYNCTSLANGRNYAIKELKKGIKPDPSLENEICILKRCTHRNIVRLFDIYEDSSSFWLVMELIQGGDLFSEVEKGAFNEMKAHSIFCQVIDGLRFLHSNHIVHRDIKLENILMKDHSIVKLTDFGFSKILKHDADYMKTRCGTPIYVAPEILNGELYTDSVDIWSSGVILYVMVFGKYPFAQDNLRVLYDDMTSGTIDFPTSISRELQNLIESILKPDPDERVTLPKILEHPWVKRYPYSFAPIGQSMIARTTSVEAPPRGSCTLCSERGMEHYDSTTTITNEHNSAVASSPSKSRSNGSSSPIQDDHSNSTSITKSISTCRDEEDNTERISDSLQQVSIQN